MKQRLFSGNPARVIAALMVAASPSAWAVGGYTVTWTGSASAIDDLILSGRCRQVQAMFRAMRSSGCAGRAADSFGSACAAP